MAQGRRVERLSALIRREISELLINGLEDQRVHQGIISITEVEVSRDLQYCKIFISIYGDSTTQSIVLEGLHDSSGFLRGEVGRKLKLRRSPQIVFQLDKSIDKGTNVLRLLNKLEEERKVNNSANDINFDKG
tara:strand:+ start:2194 stop:2592 length:399 start_codon:yes stop_codon:yes gene_type:complete